MKKIFILAAVALGLVSCDLTTPPETALDADKALVDFAGLDASAAVTYVAFTSSSWYGLDLQLYPDAMCGNCVAGDPLDTARGMSWHQWNFTAAGGFSMYGNAYVNILRCNNVIHAIKTNSEQYLAEKGVTQQMLDNIMAECLFVRAYCYFDLVRWYAQPWAIASKAAEGTAESLGAPIVDEDPAVSVIDQPARAKTVDNYKNIISDLRTAIDIIEPGFVRSGVEDPKCSVSEGAIQALLARVYLYKQQYDSAEIYATNVINSGKYAIATSKEYADPNNNYYGFWNEPTWESTGEMVFGGYMSASEGSTILGNVTSPTEYGDIRVSKDLLALFEDGDVRKKMLRTSSDFTGYYWPNKYQGKEGLMAFAGLPLIRTSEVYLIRAEARFMQGKSEEARTDLNLIASNRDASEYATIGFQDIFDERRKELAFEGHIFHDYKRLIGTDYQQGEALVRTDINTTINKDIPFDSKYWCMPIAESEKDVNPNLIQNPGWE